MDEKQVADFIRESELLRHEMAALTDALHLQAIRTQELTVATKELHGLIESRNERPGFWKRLAGGR